MIEDSRPKLGGHHRGIGRPAEGPRGGEAPAEGGGRGGDRLGLYEAPTDNTKPQQTIQSPRNINLYKAPKRLHKAPERL